MPIDKTQIQNKPQQAEKSVRDFLNKQPKNIGHSRDELIDICKVSQSRWEHYGLATKLSDCRQMVNGKFYYFNPKYL